MRVMITKVELQRTKKNDRRGRSSSEHFSAAVQYIPSQWSSLVLPDLFGSPRVWTLPYRGTKCRLGPSKHSPPLTGFQKMGVHEEVREMTTMGPPLVCKGQRSAIRSASHHQPLLINCWNIFLCKFPRIHVYLPLHCCNNCQLEDQHARPG